MFTDTDDMFPHSGNANKMFPLGYDIELTYVKREDV